MTSPPVLPKKYFDVPAMWYKDPFFWNNTDYDSIWDDGKYFCSTMMDYDENGVWSEIYNCDQITSKFYGVFWTFDTMSYTGASCQN